MGKALVNLAGLCEADLEAADDGRLLHLLRAALANDVEDWPDDPRWSSSIDDES